LTYRQSTKPDKTLICKAKTVHVISVDLKTSGQPAYLNFQSPQVLKTSSIAAYMLSRCRKFSSQL